MYWLYSMFLGLGLLISSPYWLWQALRHGKYRAGFGERMGKVPPRLLRDTRPVIWVHAVSVGEVLAVAGLIAELRKDLPGHRVVISTTTDTGHKLARSRFGDDSVFYFPLDLKFAIQPYLRKLRPQLLVIAETEFWPNFLRLADAGGARIAVVNARISDRSWPGYRRWRGILRRVLKPIDLFLAQSEEDQKRLIDVGASADRVLVSGNLKFDIALPMPQPIVEALRKSMQAANAGPIFVCGSTVEGEEEMLLSAFGEVLAEHPSSVMILAPRHPERFADVLRLLGKSSIRFWQRSRWKEEAVHGGIFLLDTIGELAALYALGDIAFVGGSLVPRGGHNILEPAQYGVPIVIGPYTENFRDIVKSFAIRGAVCVAKPAKLSETFLRLAGNRQERESLGGLAAETVRAQTGAMQRTFDALSGLLKQSSLGRSSIDRSSLERSPADTPLESAYSGKESNGATPQK